MLYPTNVEEKNVYEKEGGPGFIILDDDSQITFKAATPSNNNNNNLSILNPLHWKKIITKKLEKSHIIITTIYTIIAAFSAYFSIYGISSSLFAATFDNVKVFGGLDLKVAFSISQMIGYAISKVAGAILIPTIKRHQRWPLLVLLAVLAEIPLLFFAIFPPEGQVIMVLLSGIPLAWLWGIMVMYLEGRTTSEFLLMGLYLSVMVASGAAKSSAAAVLKSGISEAWMPCICGAVSAVIFIFFVSLLDAIPDPSSDDKKVRSERRTMTQAEARRYLVRWAPGLVIVTLTYSLLTAYRNFRDYFAPELWRDLEGEDFDPSRFTQSELPVGICTAVAYSLLYWIKDNKKAFYSILGVMFAGGFMILIATISQTSGAIDPLSWMIMVGVGLYMAYIPPGAMLYDRFNGATGNPYTSVFMIYLSDVCGYSVTLTVLFYRNFGKANLRYVDFFHSLSYISAIACMVGMVIAGIYFIITMRNISPVSDNNGMAVPVDEETGLPMTEISLDDENDNNSNSNNSNNETDGDNNNNNNNEKNEKSGKKKNKNRKKKEESASLVAMTASP